MQRVYKKKIGGLNLLQQEKQELYEHRIAELEKKSNINWVAVVFAIVVGLVIGYLLQHH